MKNHFLELYRAAYNNAIDLLVEAEILFEHKKYARAYFLAFTALEEISKSQLAADVFTEFITEDDFWPYYRDHKKKLGRMVWATNDAQRYLDADTEILVDVKKPTVTGRMDALYVHIDGTKIQGPEEMVTEEDAKSIIHTGRVAIQRIIEVTEYWGHQIGTKGFMK